MRKTAQTLLLMLALSAPIYAGEMQCPVVIEPPESANAEQEETTDGEISTTATIADVMLNLLTGIGAAF
jgi:hypothetical protein